MTRTDVRALLVSFLCTALLAVGIGTAQARSAGPFARQERVTVATVGNSDGATLPGCVWDADETGPLSPSSPLPCRTAHGTDGTPVTAFPAGRNDDGTRRITVIYDDGWIVSGTVGEGSAPDSNPGPDVSQAETIAYAIPHGVSRHVRHMMHVLHLRKLHPVPYLFLRACAEEDGSSEWECVSGPQEGMPYIVRVVRVYRDGTVLRAYTYAGPGRFRHVEYLRMVF